MQMIEKSKSTGSRDVIGFLKRQHEEIKSLFESVIAATGVERAKVFSKLKNLMAAHEAAEEAVVHPAAEDALRGGHAEVALRLQEETKAKESLAALAGLDVDSSDFETKLRTLQKAVLSHAKAEEKEEFAKLAQKLGDKELKDMRKAVEVVEAKASAPSRPSTPSSSARS
jgi:hemerythrin superfamily protein